MRFLLLLLLAFHYHIDLGGAGVPGLL